jgi:hypothetical protein
MRTNHLDICKFTSDDDENYKVVKAKVLELILGKTTIQDRTVSVPIMRSIFYLFLTLSYSSVISTSPTTTVKSSTGTWQGGR